MYLYYCLLFLGFIYKGVVMIIYVLVLVFFFVFLLFSYLSIVVLILLIVFCLIGLELFIELIGLVGEGY